jgi:hypothetical protein
MPLEKTYCVACYLFSLDALGKRRKDEARAEGNSGTTALPETSPQAAAAERKRMEACVRWLVEAQVPGHGSWTYSRIEGLSPDFSNTQFAPSGSRSKRARDRVPKGGLRPSRGPLLARSGRAIRPNGEVTLAASLEGKLRATR